MGKPLPGHKRHFFQATLVNPTTQKAYVGVGPTGQAARAQALALAVQNGENPTNLEELEIKSLVGAPPQTFTGNPNLPDDP